MAYKVYRKEIGIDSVELVNDEVYETKEEAEKALMKAESEWEQEREEIPLPGEVFGPGQTVIPRPESVTGEDTAPSNEVEFFIRED